MYTPTNTTEVEYTIEFSSPAVEFEFGLAINDSEGVFDGIEIASDNNAVTFTLPRENIRKFEFFRKRFMVKTCAYADNLITTSIYK